MENQDNLPTTLDYSDDDVSRQVARKVYREGLYALLLQSNLPGQAKTGSLRFTQKFVPLRDAEDADSRGTVPILNYMALPFKTEKKPDAPNTLGMCHTELKALGGEVGDAIPDYPRKQNGVFTYDGNEIAKDEVEAARVEVGKATMDAIKTVWDDPSSLEGHVCYGYVKIEDGFNKITRFYSAIPEGDSLVDPETWFA